MNFGAAFSYVFKDPDWLKKLVITGLITLIPVLGQLYLLGWSLEVARRVAEGDMEPRLPEVDFGASLGRGFKAFIIGLVYSLPILVITLPISIMGAFIPESGDIEETMGIVYLIVSLCCGSLAFLFSLLYAAVVPAAYTKFVTSGESIGAGLKFGEVFGMVRKAPTAYLIVILGAIVTGFVAGLGSIACGIGIIVTTAYAMVINAHLYGQAHRQAKGF